MPRKHAIKEILSTEISFIEGLNQMEKFFYIPLKQNNRTAELEISETTLDKLIPPDFKAVLDCSLKLKEKLSEEVDLTNHDSGTDSQVGRVFLELMPTFDVYCSYILKYDNAHKTLENLQKNPKFQQFLDDQSELCNGLSLGDLLILPIQRIPRYVLLLNAVIKETKENHPDYKNLIDALSQISKMASDIDAKIAQEMDKQKLIQFTDELKMPELVEPHRKFIHHEELQEMTTHTKYGVYLFSDLLVLKKCTSDSKGVKYPHKDVVIIMVDVEESIFEILLEDSKLLFKSQELLSKFGKISDITIAKKLKSDSSLRNSFTKPVGSPLNKKLSLSDTDKKPRTQRKLIMETAKPKMQKKKSVEDCSNSPIFATTTKFESFTRNNSEPIDLKSLMLDVQIATLEDVDSSDSDTMDSSSPDTTLHHKKNPLERLGSVEIQSDKNLAAPTFLKLVDDKIQLTVAICTFNVAESFTDSIGPWILSNQADIYAIGLQEIDMSPGAYVKQSEAFKNWDEHFKNSFSAKEYTKIISHRFVGLFHSIYVHNNHYQYISNFCWAKIGLGKLGLGNKGCIAFRFDLYEKSYCFINAHLTSGESKTTERNQNHDHILSDDAFSTFAVKPIAHDFLFFFGDLNYRINLKRSKALEFIAENKIQNLLENDQLLIEKQKKKIFVGFKEGDIEFLPTFKFDKNTDRYDTSKKMRVPSYCDRILVTSSEFGAFKIVKYVSKVDEHASDHRPVLAVISLEIESEAVFSKYET